MNDGAGNPRRPIYRREFEVAIVCALTLEAEAVVALFDRCWDDDGHTYGKAAGDPNVYTTGYIGRHNVVLALLPGMGKAQAASAAGSFRVSFPNIKLALLVGICGAVPGIPGSETEVVLGDVMISDGIVQCDFGRQFPGRFERKDKLLDVPGRPNAEIRGVLAKLKGGRTRRSLMDKTAKHLKALQAIPTLQAQYPGKDKDRLFEPTYQHADPEKPCEKCGCDGPVVRSRALSKDETPLPTIHFGLIASGDMVMKSGEDRDGIAERDNVIAFEMEAAGLWDAFPCVVIKSACDYADSHKSKVWQSYAAAAAAACSKSFLGYWDFTPKAKKKVAWVVPYSRYPGFVRRKAMKELPERPAHSSSSTQTRMALLGMGGTGKSQIALEYAHHVRITHSDISVFWIRGDTEDGFSQSYWDIALQCDVPEANNTSMLSVVKLWLESEKRGPWLMIIDNADDIELYQENWLAQFLPNCNHGSILFTTKNRRVAVELCPADAGGLHIQVGTMTDAGAEKLIRSRLSSPEQYTSHTLWAFARKLGHLPLALTQATAYIEENNMTIPECTTLLNKDVKSFTDFLSHTPATAKTTMGASRSVMDTLTASINLIQRQNDWAARLLSLMAYFHRDGIPKAALRAYLESIAQGNIEIGFFVSLGVLKGFFAVAEAEDNTLSIHRLVQLSVLRWLKSSQFSTLESEVHLAAVCAVSKVFPEPITCSNWLQCRQWLQHAQAVCRKRPSVWLLSRQENLQPSIDLSQKLAYFFMAQGSHEEAEKVVSDIIRLLGRFHVYHGHLKESLNISLEEICDSKIESLMPQFMDFDFFRQVHVNKRIRTHDWMAAATGIDTLLHSLEALHGAPYQFLVGKTSLAVIEMSQERWPEAEKLLRDVINGHRKSAGSKHPATLHAIHQLACALIPQRKFDESAELLKECIKSSQKILGPEHPRTREAEKTKVLLAVARKKKKTKK